MNKYRSRIVRYLPLGIIVLAVAACGPRVARAQAVQLPTFRYFSVNTTVSVPDRGSAILGGVNRSSSGTTTRGIGPLRNRASGREVGSSAASVHATIIDLDELDREVLAEAARRREARGEPLVLRSPDEAEPRSPLASKADYLSRHIARRDDLSKAPAAVDSPALSIAAVRAAAAERQARLDEEAAEKLASGKSSEAAGKFASARGYYEAAARLKVSGVSEEAAARLARIQLPSKRAERIALD
jgi:hypothetical protein